jgi:hypothetical protein
MWIPFDSRALDNQSIGSFPPEGWDVMVTDGERVAVMWFVMSSEYRWYFEDPEDSDNVFDNILTGEDLPFHPVGWMLKEDWVVYSRDCIIENLGI